MITAKLATVEITDINGRLVTPVKTVYPSSIQVCAEKFSKINPDCWVKVTSESGRQAILTPENMRKDDWRTVNGLLNLEDYIVKWMPSSKKINPKQMQKELEAAYKDDDLDLDPYANDRPDTDCNGDD